MSSERTLASTFFAAFRLSSAEFAGEMQVLLFRSGRLSKKDRWVAGVSLVRVRRRTHTALDKITIFYAYRDF
jgi:hypothetical protein